MTYHVRTDGKLNHLFDNATCVCNGKQHTGFDSRYQFVSVGKLDADKITCAKCLGKLPGVVLKEIINAVNTARRSHHGKNKSQRAERKVKAGKLQGQGMPVQVLPNA